MTYETRRAGLTGYNDDLRSRYARQTSQYDEQENKYSVPKTPRRNYSDNCIGQYI